MTDKELLELAANAAGIVGEWCNCVDHETGILTPNDQGKVWNPLQSDGDALRLAVTLGISITPYPIYEESARHSVIAKQRRRTDTMREANPTEVMELYGDFPDAATRRAIVRAAAEIGRAMGWPTKQSSSWRVRPTRGEI